MVLVADESVDFGIVKVLRQKGYNVVSILEEFQGITDKEVLRIAIKCKALLLTEDQDFGELTYRLNFSHNGVFLIRLYDMNRSERINLVVNTLVAHLDKLENRFTVLNKKGIRIKSLFK